MSLFVYLYALCVSAALLFSFYVVLNNVAKGFSKKTCLHIIGVGVIFYSIVFSWILTTYPLEYSGFTGLTSFLLLLVYYSATVVVAAVSFVWFFLLVLVKRLLQKCKDIAYGAYGRVIYTLFCGVLMMTYGYVSSFLLYLLYYSPHIDFGWYWIFADPSVLLVFTPVGLLIPFIGALGVNFLFGVSVEFLSRFSFRKTIVVYLFFGVLSCMYIGYSSKIMSATTSISVPLAGTNILDMDGNRIISTSMYDTKKPQETVMRVIEKTQPSTTFFAPEAVGTRYELLESVRRAKSHIIYGGPYYKNGLSYNGLMEYSFDGSSYPQSITEKKFLIPFGEYIPLVFTYSGALFLSDENFTKVITRKQRDSGRGLQEKWINGELYVVGLCSDFWSREGIAVAKKSQARKALAFESNSFFRNNRWFLVNLYAWHTYFAKSTGKTLVSVPNDSPIWVINGSW